LGTYRLFVQIHAGDEGILEVLVPNGHVGIAKVDVPAKWFGVQVQRPGKISSYRGGRTWQSLSEEIDPQSSGQAGVWSGWRF
jgi:hypothetical protein